MTNVFHTQVEACVNLFELMLFQEKSMQFFSWCFFFFYSCNYAPHVNSSRDLHEVIVGTTSTDAFLLHFN